MPSASDAQHQIMKEWFGSEVGEEEPRRFLAARGWTEQAGMYSPPVPSHNPSIYEVECLLFLRDEWDYDFTFNYQLPSDFLMRSQKRG